MQSATQRSPLQNDTKISVLIPAYNAANFLARAAHSALSQTLPPVEIIIVDDGSSDNTLSVAKELAKGDARVKVLSLNCNSGPSAARNKGIDAAEGDWIAILDADDAYLPDRLERMTVAAVEHGVDIVVDNFVFYDAIHKTMTSSALGERDTTEYFDLYNFLENCRANCAEADWGLLKPIFRRDFLNKHKLRYQEDSYHGEDFLLMFHALLATRHGLLVRTPGYLYTTRDSGMSRTKIDYSTMFSQMEALLNDPMMQADGRASELLSQAIEDVRRLAVESRLQEAKKNGRHLAVLFLILTQHHLARDTIQAVFRKIRSRI